MNRRQFLASAAGFSSLALIDSLTFGGDSEGGELTKHRITAIDFQQVDLRWPRQVGRNAVKGIHGRGPRATVCVLKTNQGAIGWGMIRGNRRSVTAISERVVGKSVESLFVPSSGVAAPYLNPLDFALHDLAGVILEMPVWKMVSGSDPKKPFVAPIYSGMIYFDDLDPTESPAGVDKLIEECKWDYNYGYRQFKLKIGRGHKWMKPSSKGMERDILAVRTIAREFPDCDILVDANNGYTVNDCIEFLEGVKGVPLFWIEEPFHETVADYRRLKRQKDQLGFAKTYLADGEARPDTAVLEKLQAEKILDIRLEDIVGFGFTPWRQLLKGLIQKQVLASPHTWGSGLKTVYVAHLAGGLGNVPTIEGVTCSHDDFDIGENVIRDGKQQVSSQGGFGMKLKT